ncbi:MAG: excinuclease ABC subunit UvrC [Saprospiraceae bacterium]|nr:excinuclease ABC subunit UvrC [Saprospiraceae bacterium]MCF8251496.1 excinuclease ABC subunit UvrC [Saprospiraceae bacterium]MCF8280746.1 excinuclease ABC subunit UvrC [Bacteroidales bacterium]MCF8313356.1 excinuclease ABC subunit UvrC [Saprospiraceae bacterium]MCF8441824.1 excinuclease ABC subunit UvrC [Saprospiraceae bacterium]
MTTDDYKKLLPNWPHDPGVYRFLDAEERVLYVGKAKNLKNRLSSYFSSQKDMAYKTRVMVKHAHRIEMTLVDTEADALLLESTLIKRFQPPYNVMLKDGKSYTYLCIKNERFPRVFLTRRVIRDGSTYFGPYTSKFRVEVILDLIKQLFPLRTCNLSLTEENIAKGKFKVCLEYHIKNCQGPCEGFETEEAYNEKIEQIKNMLRGNFGPVKRHFQQEMARHAEQMAFEKAQQIKEKLTAFEDYQGKSTVVSTTIRDVDVFSIASDEKNAYVNYIKVVNGAIINAWTQEMVKNLDDDEADLLSFTILEIRERFQSIAPEVIVPFEVELADPTITMTVPKIGDKKKLLELSEKNVHFFLLQKKKEEASQTGKQTSAERILKTLQSDLQLADVPLHIECFDNSNMQGSYPVSSCVVFRNAKPSKSDYRHYNVKTVVGPNDFATMEEVVYRRYKRLLAEGQTLPQLIIIDGGKGQLSAAVKSLEALGILDKVTVVGIAKRLEEIFFPGDSVPLYVNKKSESLKLIQQARNEAHRFAITFHRNQRSKDFTKTELEDIPGIGTKTAERLLKHFGSVKKMREANGEEIEKAIGKGAAAKVAKYFKAEESGGGDEQLITAE